MKEKNAKINKIEQFFKAFLKDAKGKDAKTVIKLYYRQLLAIIGIIIVIAGIIALIAVGIHSARVKTLEGTDASVISMDDYDYIPTRVTVDSNADIGQEVKDKDCDIVITKIGNVADDTDIQSIAGFENGTYIKYTVSFDKAHNDELWSKDGQYTGQRIGATLSGETSDGEGFATGGKIFVKTGDSWSDYYQAGFQAGSVYEFVQCYEYGIDANSLFAFSNTKGILTMITIEQ